MGRVLSRQGVLCWASLTLVAMPASGESSIAASLEAGLVDVGPMPSFAEGSQGKQRYGRNDEPLQLLSGYLQFESDVAATWHARMAVDFNRQADRPLGVTEAYLQFRPLPVAGIRWRARFGAFRPPLSFEHGSDGWATLYTTNASAINSWVGEELGGLGVEVTARRDLASTESSWYWAGSGALFYANDTSGTLLSWRGWSANNWQTAWGGHIPLTDLPIYELATSQAARAEPFIELDDRPGYYLWGELGQARRLRLRATYYDNRAALDARRPGQSGWRTTFTALSGQLALPWNLGLIAQWMDGRTEWGRIINGRAAVDNDFDSYFVMVTRTFGPHRVSVRREEFRVDDNDFVAVDPNGESGQAWTLSYQFDLNDRWRFGVEWLGISSRRPARVFEDAPISLDEDSLYLVARWRL